VANTRNISERGITLGQLKKEWEQRTSERAEKLAQERYYRDFAHLSPPLQMQTWMEAESLVAEEMNKELEAAQKQVRKSGVRVWDELELGRRLGK
jgi:hypothetical protein